MSRPKGRNGTPLKLYINPAVRRAADKIAFKSDKSLSSFVEMLLERAIKAAAKKQEAAA